MLNELPADFTHKHSVIFNLKVASPLVPFGFGLCPATAQCLCYVCNLLSASNLYPQVTHAYRIASSRLHGLMT